MPLYFNWWIENNKGEVESEGFKDCLAMNLCDDFDPTTIDFNKIDVKRDGPDAEIHEWEAGYATKFEKL